MRQYIRYIALVFIIVVAIVIGAYFNEIKKFIPHLWSYGLLLISIVMQCYQNHMGTYRLISMLKLWLTNNQICWSLRIVFKGGFDGSCYKNMIEELNSNGKNVQLINKRKNLEVIVIDGMVIELRYFPSEERETDDEITEAELSIYIPDYKVAYNSSRAILFDSIMPRINRLTKEVFTGIKFAEEYSITARFLSANPFLGYYISKIRPKEIISMSCNIRETYAEISNRTQSDIEITKGYIQVSSSSLDAIRRSLERYLFL